MTKIDVGELQEFIWHLHDDTRWPAKYYKAVINYCLDKAKNPDLEPPEEIHYTRCVIEYAPDSLKKNRCPVCGLTTKPDDEECPLCGAKPGESHSCRDYEITSELS